jgi:hypothetical protein
VVTKPSSIVRQAFALHELGWNDAQIASKLRVSRATVRNWLGDPSKAFRSRSRFGVHEDDQVCGFVLAAATPEYAYLFGQYLGDGCISAMGPRGVFRLRIQTCDEYPDIRARVIAAMEVVMPDRKVGVCQRDGCTEVSGYSKHWPCLFPQHGPGRKHERLIALAGWQKEVVNQFPQEFVAGLIHSDGCRATNNVVVRGKAYSYPRYFFSNVSEDILRICGEVLTDLGVEWKKNRWNSISIAKRESVAYLDTFIGPKR